MTQTMYFNRFHKNSINIIKKQYPLTVTSCIHGISSEMIARADNNTIFIFSSLSDIGSNTQILLGLKYIFEQSSYLLVLDNEQVSTARIVAKDNLKCEILPDDNAFQTKKPIVDELLKYTENELTIYHLPLDFPEHYWKYELGTMKLSDAYKNLGVSKPYFYKLCEIYEDTIDFYIRQYHTSTDVIQAPKKRETDYKKIIDILKPFEDIGLTFKALTTLEEELNICWIDLWRTLISMKKSRYYYYLLKDNPTLKDKLLHKDIYSALESLESDPTRFIQFNAIPLFRYVAPEERLQSFL